MVSREPSLRGAWLCWQRQTKAGQSRAARGQSRRPRKHVFVGSPVARGILHLDGCEIGECRSVGLKKHISGHRVCVCVQRGSPTCPRVSAYKAHSGWEGWKPGDIPVVLAGDGRQTRGKDAHAFVRDSRVQSVHRDPVRACATDTSSGSCRGKKTPAGEKAQKLVHLHGGEGGGGLEAALGPEALDRRVREGAWRRKSRATRAAPEELTPPVSGGTEMSER